MKTLDEIVNDLLDHIEDLTQTGYTFREAKEIILQELSDIIERLKRRI